MPQKMMRIVSDVPGTEIDPSNVDLTKSSIEERQAAMVWLNDNGAIILSADAGQVAYEL